MTSPENRRPADQIAEDIITQETEGLYNFLTSNYATSLALDQAEVILEAMEVVAEEHTMPALAQIDILSICRDALVERVGARLEAHGFNIAHLGEWPYRSSVEDCRGNDEAVQAQLNALRQLIKTIRNIQDAIVDLKEAL